MLTDYALAAWTVFLGIRLWRRSAGQRAVQFWAASFAATGLAALTGGTVHGFSLMLPLPVAVALWKVTLYSIGLGSLLLLLGAAWAALSGRARRALLAVALIKFAAYLVWMGLHDDFRYVVFSYVPDMLAVIALLTLVSPDMRGSPRAWGISGVLASLAAAAVQVSGVSLHTHFNHNDLYHVMQALAFLLLYRAGTLLRDSSAQPT